VAVGLRRIAIQGYRSAQDVELSPGALCALVGDVGSGKSIVLGALYRLLEAAAPLLTPDDVSYGERKRIHVEAELADGRTIFLDARPPVSVNLNREGAPEAVFLPAWLRAGSLVAPCTAEGAGALVAELLRRPGDPSTPWADARDPERLRSALERCIAAGVEGVVLLVEEPELFLSPQSQRALYRTLRRFAEAGNQVVYSTHSPAFLRVEYLHEVALVRRDAATGTTIQQPRPLAESESLRALAEFDAERSELFLARAALLVEGRTERTVLPFVFDALGIDPDRERVLVLECGGKSNIPLFARVCNECSIPYVVLHDRDAPAGAQPNLSERTTNEAISAIAGPARTIVLVPDFETVTGYKARRRKPEQARRRFVAGAEVPRPLREAVERVVAAARGARA
jgi:energy-coupling factor transporter ATP-binding protein EcfA2